MSHPHGKKLRVQQPLGGWAGRGLRLRIRAHLLPALTALVLPPSSGPLPGPPVQGLFSQDWFLSSSHGSKVDMERALAPYTLCKALGRLGFWP